MHDPVIRIAIADDHALVRSGIIALIQLLPSLIVVAEAENGKELINLISKLKTPPDICILDISMPVLNGYNTVIALKKLYPVIRCLALTMFDNEYSIIRMIKNGANGYLLKGCSIEELHQAIITVHDQGYYYSSVASQKTFVAVKNNFLPELTEKELEFLCHCCTELSYEKIGALMYISVHTVHDYAKNVGEKLNIHNRIGLALFAIHIGLVPINKNMHPEE